MTDRPAFSATGRRARILRATRSEPLTLSEIVRRTAPRRPASSRDESLQRLKTTAAIRQLKADGLLARTPSGWAATSNGRAALQATEVQDG